MLIKEATGMDYAVSPAGPISLDKPKSPVDEVVPLKGALSLKRWKHAARSKAPGVRLLSPLNPQLGKRKEEVAEGMQKLNGRKIKKSKGACEQDCLDKPMVEVGDQPRQSP
jgi:hypothetical protein